MRQVAPTRRMPASPVSRRTALPSGGAVASMFFVSGAVALIYEVIWQRQFALLFGSGATAAAAVLAAYFAGLGAGAWAVGRWTRRWRRPLRAYAVLELLIGGGALLVSPLLHAFEAAYPWIYANLSGHPVWFTLARIGVAFAALLLPTFCMGGTLPLLGEWIDRNQRKFGVTAGGFYVVNTAGAALGAVAVPFFFLPRLGMAWTIIACALVNATLGAVAWWLDRTGKTDYALFPSADENGPTGAQVIPGQRGVLLAALVSGVATFALQVLWNRAFAQVHENSMHSFAVIVGVVIFSLAVGGQIARAALRRGADAARLIGGAWILAGVTVLAGPWLFLQVTNELEYLPQGGGGHLGRLFGLACVVVLAPMTLLGIGLPALMERAGSATREEAARVLGRLLAVNVAGSVAGALLAGFALPHWLGLWNAMLWLGVLVLLMGIAQWRPARFTKAWQIGALTAWALSAWLVAPLDLPRVRLAREHGEQMIALNEGTHGITAVTERRGSRRLKLNNHYALGGTAATGDERMQAHVPLWLHPRPKQVAFLGLGTGISAGAATFHPVERVVVMELVPAVIAAARRHFTPANAGVLDDPRTVIVADDARHYLRGAGERFDVIIGDLVVPWRQGEGALFTLEQFQAAQRSLAPGGLFCQWVPLFQLSELELTILARTFLRVFPQAQVWRGDFSPTEPAIALIGSQAALSLNPDVVAQRLAEMRPDPTNPQLSLSGVAWMNFVGVITTDDLPASDSRINREDRPWIELLGGGGAGGLQRSESFTGRKLHTWLSVVRQRTVARDAALPEAIKRAMLAGETLSEMVLCLAENNGSGALRAQQQLKTILPEVTYKTLFP